MCATLEPLSGLDVCCIGRHWTTLDDIGRHWTTLGDIGVIGRHWTTLDDIYYLRIYLVYLRIYLVYLRASGTIFQRIYLL